MTLDQAWKNCLAQWKWINEQLDKDKGLVIDKRREIETLKERWCHRHRYVSIFNHCFFCQYGCQRMRRHPNCCVRCPGVLVDPAFSCLNPEYHFVHRPNVFYQKLLQLHAMYKMQKKMRESGVNANRKVVRNDNN